MFGWLKKQQKIDMRWAYGALVAYIAMTVVNWLAGSTSVLGGKNTAAVSDSFPNLFAPAGVTFAIWGLIYLLLGLFFFRMFEIWKPKKSAVSNRTLNQVIVMFTASSLLNMVWLLAWQYNLMALSVVVMVGLLLTLIRINQLLASDSYDIKEYALLKLPFSVYFGWITVATIANISAWLVSFGWNGWGMSEGFWMVGVLLVGAAIAMAGLIKNKDWAYGAVFVWAYAGILLKHLADDGWNGRWPSVLAALYIILPVLIITTINVAVKSINKLTK